MIAALRKILAALALMPSLSACSLSVDGGSSAPALGTAITPDLAMIMCGTCPASH